MSRVSLDTSVIAEYIDLAGPFHQHAVSLIDRVRAGRITAVIPHPILAETYYIALKLYTQRNTPQPQTQAVALIAWLYQAPNFVIAEPTLDLALEAGKIKARFGLALTDAYVLAAGKLYDATALFRRAEKEMAQQLAALTKNYGIVFLEDYAA